MLQRSAVLWLSLPALLSSGCEALSRLMGEKPPEAQAALPAAPPAANAPAPAPSPTDPAIPAGAKSFQGEFDTGKALALLYGPGEEIHWSPTAAELSRLALRDDQKKDFARTTVYEIESQQLRAGSEERAVLLTQACREQEGGDPICMAGAALIGAALFTRRGDRWYLARDERAIAVAGLDAQTLAALRQIGPSRYAVTVGDCRGSDSDCSDWNNETWYELAEEGPTREIADFEVSRSAYCEEDEGGCLDFSFEAEIKTSPGKDPAYFDVELAYKGNKPNKSGKKLIELDGVVERYTFRDGKYQLASAPRP